MSMFHVGQLVVCVDDSEFDPQYGEKLPVKVSVYTIRECLPDLVLGWGVKLEEIVNEPQEYWSGFEECDFHAARFRPVKTTSIDVFTALLNKTPERETA